MTGYEFTLVVHVQADDEQEALELRDQASVLIATDPRTAPSVTSIDNYPPRGDRRLRIV